MYFILITHSSKIYLFICCNGKNNKISKCPLCCYITREYRNKIYFPLRQTNIFSVYIFDLFYLSMYMVQYKLDNIEIKYIPSWDWVPVQYQRICCRRKNKLLSLLCFIWRNFCLQFLTFQRKKIYFVNNVFKREKFPRLEKLQRSGVWETLIGHHGRPIMASHETPSTSELRSNIVPTDSSWTLN